ncbi:MAG TPA: YkvA family protein [Longimicrobiaceae bacterium]|nr:YkvA family protein [Longimicrobiaceae bacterium]
MARFRDDVPRARLHAVDNEAAEDAAAVPAPRLRRRSRGSDLGTAEGVKQLIRDLPNFVKLLYRLVRDPRVSRLDKALLLATVAYILSPVDILLDVIPFFGQVDDVYLLALTLDRLLNNAGMDVLLDHWEGEMSSLEMAISGLDKAGSFLPEPIRRLLHQRVR